MQTLNIYFDQEEIVTVPINSAMNYLKQYDHFKVFVDFIHPNTNCYTDGYVTLYPKPQRSRLPGCPPWCFITEHEGIILRLPSNMNWWVGSPLEMMLNQTVSYLSRGEIKYSNIKITVGHFRIPGSPKPQALKAIT